MPRLSVPPARNRLYESVEGERDRLVGLATEIWENPKLSLEEHDAAGRLQDALREEGFAVESGIAGIETAFTARYGEGDPTIGVIGEFDALPDLSQKRTAGVEYEVNVPEGADPSDVVGR